MVEAWAEAEKRSKYLREKAKYVSSDEMAADLGISVTAALSRLAKYQPGELFNEDGEPPIKGKPSFTGDELVFRNPYRNNVLIHPALAKRQKRVRLDGAYEQARQFANDALCTKPPHTLFCSFLDPSTARGNPIELRMYRWEQNADGEVIVQRPPVSRSIETGGSLEHGKELLSRIEDHILGLPGVTAYRRLNNPRVVVGGDEVIPNAPIRGSASSSSVADLVARNPTCERPIVPKVVTSGRPEPFSASPNVSMARRSASEAVFINRPTIPVGKLASRLLFIYGLFRRGFDKPMNSFLIELWKAFFIKRISSKTWRTSGTR